MDWGCFGLRMIVMIFKNGFNRQIINFVEVAGQRFLCSSSVVPTSSGLLSFIQKYIALVAR